MKKKPTHHKSQFNSASGSPAVVGFRQRSESFSDVRRALDAKLREWGINDKWDNNGMFGKR